jgi:phage terminase large subunit
LKLRLETSGLFRKNLEATDSIVVNQGGSRSGKTYSILQVLIIKAHQTFTIARKTLKSLRSTAMRDFFEILERAQMYDQSLHNKSDNIYFINGNRFEFMGMDDPQKKRGAKRHILFCNEANELAKEDFLQLELRTTEQIFIDFNPSDEYHWLYEDVIPRAHFIKSTYRNNPFLDALTIQRIERLKETDPQAWQVYGLGERAISRDNVFTFDERDIPKEAKLMSMGMDFGFTNDPTAFVEVWQDGDDVWIKERIYRTDMTNQDIGRELANLNIDRRDAIYCDSAEPKSIEELRRMGWNVRPADKGKDSVNAGIQLMKTFKLHVEPSSTNLIKELRNYKWTKDKDGRNLNKPVDAFNHAIDATRYAIFSKVGKPNHGKYHLR